MTTPTGILSQPLDALRTMLSECAAFQVWTGAASASAALAYVHPWYYDATNDSVKLAMVNLGQNHDNAREALSGSQQFSRNGTLELYFRELLDDTSRTAAEGSDLLYSHFNSLGAILFDLENLSIATNPSYLRISQISMTGWYRPTDDEAETDGDYVESMWTITYYRRK